MKKFYAETKSCLSREDELELIEKAHLGDKESRNELITSNMGFVKYLASEFVGRGLPFEDLVQAGSIGLIESVERFNIDSGVRFITFAGWWIKHEILNEIENTARMIRLPQNRENQLSIIKKELAKLPANMSAEEKKGRICQTLGIKEDVYKRLMEMSGAVRSLDSKPSENTEEGGLYNCIENKLSVNPEDELVKKEVTSKIERVLKNLTQKEADVVRMRFGIGGEREKSLSEVGDYLNCSREYVRQIEMRACKKLALPENARYLDGFLAA